MDGSGVITGNFDYDSANALAIQLRYGSLPIPLKVVETTTVGPTLGQDSLQKSMIAGVIGFSIVILFMGLYYRLPGIVADINWLIFLLSLSWSRAFATMEPRFPFLVLPNHKQWSSNKDGRIGTRGKPNEHSGSELF